MLTSRCPTCKRYVDGKCTLPVKEGQDQKEECEKLFFITDVVWNGNDSNNKKR